MDGTQKAPAHLWIVGILALLWNGFGCFDYFMTRTRGVAYIESMMPGSDATAIMDHITGFPIFASIGWGLGVWGGLVGAILLLMRNRHAATALGLSLLGALAGLGWQLLNPIPLAEAYEGVNGMMPYIIIAVAALLFVYARAQKAKGVLA